MEGRSLEETPTWAFATVITVLVSLGFFFHVSLKQFGKWLDKTRRKSLLAALEKIKEELMLFGVLSLLMGHWIVVVAKICVKTSALSSKFFPCALDGQVSSVDDFLVSTSESVNKSVPRKHFAVHEYCSQGHESFASHESLEQLHRFIFVLGTTHVFYSFAAIALAMLKIYSWRVWENEAKVIANQSLEDSPEALPNCARMRRMSTFIDHHTSHSWSQHKFLVWMLCFSRQFWSSINRSDYMALRLGFITTHQLPLSYDFHNYMLRSMEEEFRDIVGISIPLWIYAICCIFLDFHGSNIYFWLSFLPAILILLIGTKLHRVVVKLAVEIMDNCPYMENRRFKLRDELFWFGKPRLLLHLIQLISFQNAFEMATFIWSLWEIKEPSCFMDNRRFLAIRLSFGVISQFWCSFITFPLYVIITQMGSRFKRTVISEGVRRSLSGWKRRVKARHSTPHTTPLLSSTPTTTTTTTTSSDSVLSGTHRSDDFASTSTEGSSSGVHNTSHGIGMSRQFPFFGSPLYDSFSSNDSEIRHRSVNNNDATSP
ncbi:MLO-like protein 4 [Morus notabilis]|uniref:MLO-like protein n=1 Tax=Morus notabilis TaxID=981085 RepID=W9SKJ9_9ROSA|nr:MLO-like protein 4 [Morus notabilis]EXC35341.1 MLO-like protein 4 [Morus notabilis]